MTEQEQPLAAYYLGLLEGEEHLGAERAIRSDAALRARCIAWPNVIAAITMGALIFDRHRVEGRMEQRLIQRARLERPAKVHSYRALRVARRGLVWVTLAGLIALAAVFGYLAFSPDEPISGRAVALTENGATGVLLPRYEERLFALIFWGLPPLQADDTWQVWLVRESGAVEPGPMFSEDGDGRAAVTIDPNLIEISDELIGFAVSRDNPAERSDGTPSADDILYQFPRR